MLGLQHPIQSYEGQGTGLWVSGVTLGYAKQVFYQINYIPRPQYGPFTEQKACSPHQLEGQLYQNQTFPSLIA